MTRYVEVQYPKREPFVGNVITRHNNALWVIQYKQMTRLDYLSEIGATITPLIAMTPERVAALQVVKNALSIFGDTKRLLAVQEINAMLAEAEGENNE